MSASHRFPHLLTVGALVVAAAACGSDSTSSQPTEPSPATLPPAAATTESTEPSVTESTTTESTEPVGGPVSAVTDVKSAVVQVLAEGSFRDPVEGTQGFAGSGSGFIIDPDGIVVTNNHVVTGAGVVKVRVGGSTDEIPARVLGVSECNDLAVLQLNDLGPYPYLAWYDGELIPPLEVYTAGFPLGDPEYTVTRGVVSKAEADGQSSWASVRHVIEHDANIQPGNSGGPLVTADGRVAGVNYAGADVGTGTNQFFAIAADLAIPVVEQLRQGSQETIGVNGQAVVTDDGTVGVWVAGVAPGSPASATGTLPGDVITTLNGVSMSPGTMQSYCDVLRTANPGAPISIQVMRFDTGEVWEGELNGTPMTARFSFANEFADDVAPTDPAAPAPEPGTDPTEGGGYDFVTDDTGSITVQLPVDWADRDLTPSYFDLVDTEVPSIMAAPDLEAFLSLYTAPGMIFLGAPSGGSNVEIESMLDRMAPTDAACTFGERSDYEDGVFGGQSEVWTCGEGTLYLSVVAKAIANSDAFVIVLVQATTEAHLAALDQILWTFNFSY